MSEQLRDEFSSGLSAKEVKRLSMRARFLRYRWHGNINDADCAVLLPFGDVVNDELTGPGPGNASVAWDAKRIIGDRKIPIIASREVNAALLDLKWPDTPTHLIDCYQLFRKTEDNLGALALQAAKIVEVEELGSRVALITNPYRMTRAEKLLEFTLPESAEVVVPRGLSHQYSWDLYPKYEHAQTNVQAASFEARAIYTDFVNGHFMRNPSP